MEKQTFQILSVGKYKLVERRPGYKNNETSIIRNQKGMTEVLSLKVENEQLDKGSVELQKWIKIVAALAGVTFEVQDEKAK